MPELPEVETVRTGVEQYLKGKRLLHVLLRRKNLRVALPAQMEKELKGRTLTAVTRRAKYLLFHMSGGKVLLVHLGMSGSIVLKNEKPAQYRTHDHVIIEWSGGMWMLFHDPRRFGLMLLLEESELATHKLLVHLGPEPLSSAWNGKKLYTLLHAAKAPVKSVLMDQHKLVGVGNIYACEALFRAKIHPARSAQKVTQTEANLLATSIKAVLREAIASGGSTLRDYVRSSGDMGYFQHHFSVYGRQNQPCLACKTPIAVIRQAGRSSFFCPVCQK